MLRGLRNEFGVFLRVARQQQVRRSSDKTRICHELGVPLERFRLAALTLYPGLWEGTLNPKP